MEGRHTGWVLKLGSEQPADRAGVALWSSMEPPSPRVTTEAAGDEAVRGKVASGSFDMRGSGGVLTDIIVQTLTPRLFGFPLTRIRALLVLTYDAL